MHNGSMPVSRLSSVGGLPTNSCVRTISLSFLPRPGKTIRLRSSDAKFTTLSEILMHHHLRHSDGRHSMATPLEASIHHSVHGRVSLLHRPFIAFSGSGRAVTLTPTMMPVQLRLSRSRIFLNPTDQAH